MAAASPHALPLPMPRVAPRSIRWLCSLAIVALAFWLGREGAIHIIKGDPDFEYFYKGGAALLAKGTLDPGYDLVGGRLVRRGTLDWYLPCVPRLLTLLAWMPYQAAGFVWLGLNIAAFVAILRLVGRHLSGLPPQDWTVTQLVPVLLLIGFWWWEFRLNQVNNLTLLLLVGSFACWQSGRSRTSGLWLGLAVLLKLTPALLVIWFLLKREYVVVAVALLTVVLAGPVSDTLALSPDLAAGAYRSWFARAVTDGSHRALILTDRELDWRNQGLGAVASRWLTNTSYATRFDNDPRIQASLGQIPPRRLNVADWRRESVAAGVNAAAMLLVLALVWLARRPARQLTAWQLRFEWALFVSSMLLLMPVMRRYHMIWAYPAVALIAAGAHYCAFRGIWVWAGMSSLAALAATQALLWLTPEAGFVTSVTAVEAAGAFLAAAGLISLVVGAMLLMLQRAPSALPPPHFAVLRGGRAAAPPQLAVGADHA